MSWCCLTTFHCTICRVERMSDVGRSKSPLDWGARMLYGMQQLWRSRHLCDYTIIINQHSFLVHRAFMAAVSDYFYAMLTGGMQETYKDSIELKGVPENGLQLLLEFLYTGKLTLTTDNVCSVLIASAYLQVEPAVHYCSRFLEGAISPDNVLDILDVAKLYSLIDVKSAAMSYILQHFESVAQRQGHVRLEYEDLKWVLSNEDFQHKREFELYKCIQQWLNHEPETRCCHGYELMRLVYFALTSPSELDEILSECRESPWFRLVNEARLYHNLPMHQKVTAQSQQTTVRSKPSIVAYQSNSFGQSTNTLYSLTPPANEWLVHRDLDVGPYSTYLGSAAVVKNFLVICGGFLNSENNIDEVSNKCYIFDPQTYTWSTMAPMITPRAYFPLVSCRGFLYALGGLRKIVRHTAGPSPAVHHVHTRGVERYSFHANRWEAFSWSSQATKHHAACALGDCIYVSGGMFYNGLVSCLSDQMVSVDTITKDWESLEPLSEEMNCHFMLPLLQERLLLVGVYEEDVVRWNMAVYSPATDQWSRLCTSYLPRDAEVVAVENDLYFINGWVEDAYGNEGIRGGVCMKMTYDGGHLHPPLEVDGRVITIDSFLDVDYPLCVSLRLPTHLTGNTAPKTATASWQASIN